MWMLTEWYLRKQPSVLGEKRKRGKGKKSNIMTRLNDCTKHVSQVYHKYLIDQKTKYKFTFFVDMINGAIAGLVCITPAAGYVDMTGAFFIGYFGGPLCYGGIQLKHKLGTEWRSVARFGEMCYRNTACNSSIYISF
jgi:Ammonium Transporter Family